MTAPPDPAQTPPVALCLGGFDPSAGAGVLRDALTLQALGVHPMAVPTAETIQNGRACLEITAPGAATQRRVEALKVHLSGHWGVKLGLCAMEEGALRNLLDAVESCAPRVRLWDPILAPTSGVGLHDADTLRRLAAVVLRRPGWVVCPNRPEAAALAGIDPGADPRALARPWLDRGAEAVWLKGGHVEGETVEDLWVRPEGVEGLGAHPRLPGDRRGTGCTLGSAWLGFRLHGLGPEAAARRAAAWLRARWPRAFAPGGAGRPLFAPEAP